MIAREHIKYLMVHIDETTDGFPLYVYTGSPRSVWLQWEAPYDRIDLRRDHEIFYLSNWKALPYDHTVIPR